MDLGGSPLPDTVSPDKFPAKLWRLVNNPAIRAICWDSHGEAITIKQSLFEIELLCANTFHTTNFSSFVRQLNLYGFRKVRPVDDDDLYPAGESGTWHHYYNPNFRRNEPDLVVSVRRIQTKRQGVRGVDCQPPNRYQLLSGGGRSRDTHVKRGSPSVFSPIHLESTCPYYSNKAPAMAVHNGTPVPPTYLRIGPSSAVFTAVVTGRQPNFGPSHLTGNGSEVGSFSPHSYDAANVPVNMSNFGDPNQDPQPDKYHNVKKCDINLNTIFQIANEAMQSLPSNTLARVVSREKPRPVSSDICESMLFDSPASTMQADPLCSGPIIVSVTGNASPVTFNQQEESVLSVSEQMPEDAILEISTC